MMNMEKKDWENLRSLIMRKTGLYIQEKDFPQFIYKMKERIRRGSFSDLQEYYTLLQRDGDRSQQEWQQIFVLLTTAESYFFRDKKQFSMLEEFLLPEVRELRKKEKTLRIWSAGCSSGEEPYSIAIVLKKMIAHFKDWNILILGSDINLEMLEKARKGIYHSWSLRNIDPEIEKNYFIRNKDTWHLDKQILQKVAFLQGNLVEDIFPSCLSPIHDIDIIFCRNVFIYFSQETIAIILAKFANTLKENGYLVTGHGELYAQNLQNFQKKTYHGMVVYQKNSVARDHTKTFPLQNKHKKQNTPIRGLFKISSITRTIVFIPDTNLKSLSEEKKITLEDIRSFIDKSNYIEALEKAKKLILQEPDNLELHFLTAQANANTGEYSHAIEICLNILKKDIAHLDACFLLSQIYETQGDKDKAKKFLQNVIYINPYFIAAYLNLGEILKKEGDSKNAKKMFLVAQDLLESLPPHTHIFPYQNTTSGELLKHVVSTIGKISI